MRVSSLLIACAVLLALGMPARAARVGRPAPDFAGGGPWVNTGGRALTMAALRGRVVAVEVWTAGCYNCRNVIPSLKQWDAGYRQRGFVIVGVHSPEFAYEHDEAYVRKAVARLGIRYPVVMDNGFRIWRAYSNIYWPTIYLVDKRGILRYTHIGEGAYDETDQMIRRLLAENS